MTMNRIWKVISKCRASRPPVPSTSKCGPCLFSIEKRHLGEAKEVSSRVGTSSSLNTGNKSTQPATASHQSALH